MRALYISTSVNYEAPVKALQKYFAEVHVLAPWAPPMKLVNVFRKLKLARVSRIIVARVQTFKFERNVQIGWIGVGQFFFPIWSHLNLRRYISPRRVENIAKIFYFKKIRSNLSDFDLVILPSDFIDILEIYDFPKATRVVIEIRWHHLSANRLRPPLYIDFPEASSVANSDFDKILSKNREKIQAIITYSEFAANSYQKIDFPPENIFVVPISIDMKLDSSIQLKNSSRTKPLLYVGRSEPDKGLDLAVQVANLTGLEITVVGSASEKVVSWLRLFPNVTYLGVLDKPSLYLEMMRHKVFMSTGIESFGMALVESLSLGMSVVGTNLVGAINWYGSLPQVFVSQSLDQEDLCQATLDALAMGDYDLSKSSAFIQINAMPYWSRVISQILGLRTI